MSDAWPYCTRLGPVRLVTEYSSIMFLYSSLTTILSCHMWHGFHYSSRFHSGRQEGVFQSSFTITRISRLSELGYDQLNGNHLAFSAAFNDSKAKL